MFYWMFQIYKLSLKSERCSDIHRILAIECICAFAPGEEGDKLRYIIYIIIMCSDTTCISRIEHQYCTVTPIPH